MRLQAENFSSGVYQFQRLESWPYRRTKSCMHLTRSELQFPASQGNWCAELCNVFPIVSYLLCLIMTCYNEEFTSSIIPIIFSLLCAHLWSIWFWGDTYCCKQCIRNFSFGRSMTGWESSLRTVPRILHFGRSSCSSIHAMTRTRTRTSSCYILIGSLYLHQMS